MTYTVKQVARLLDMSEHAIRYYDREGLMPFLNKDRLGKRMFTEDDICHLELIKCLKKSKMSLSDMREYIILSLSCDKTEDLRKVILEKQREIILKEITELNESLCTIEYKIRRCCGKCENE